MHACIIKLLAGLPLSNILSSSVLATAILAVFCSPASLHTCLLQSCLQVSRSCLDWQDCSRSPAEVGAQRDTARTIQQQEEDLQKLQDRVSVLAHAKETDARRFRQIAVERQREREDLKREVERLKVWTLSSLFAL